MGAWARDIRATLHMLAEHRPLRISVLMAANAVRMPYGNLFHDAQLYAFQVLNRVSHGAFSNDLFFRFGSQDQYTPFSRVVAPVAAIIGIDWCFFLCFLLFNTVLIIAIDRLVETLIGDPALRPLVCGLIVLSPLPYAGLGVFHVQEHFFTPRLIATGLGLFALDSMIRQRPVRAVTLAAAATLVHPLMGFGVVLAVTIVVGGQLPRRIAAVTLGLALTIGSLLLVHRPLGTALFGSIDDEWLQIIREAAAYTLPGGWVASDWVRTGTALAVVIAAALATRTEHLGHARMLLATVIAAVAGIAAAAMAELFAYRLLVQAQPYRSVWIVHALQIPAAFLLARHLWRRGGWAQPAAVLVLGLIAIVDFVAYEALLSLAALPFVLIALKRSHVRLDPGGVTIGLMASLSLGFATWGALKLALAVAGAPRLLEMMDAISYTRRLMGCIPAFVLMGLILTVVAAVARPGRAVRCAVFVAGIGIAIHAVAFAFTESRELRARVDPRSADIEFAGKFVRARYATTPHAPTVYAGAWGDSGPVWFDLHAQSYFAAVVVIFNRETALETRRRAALVRSFELERYRHAASLPEVFRRRAHYLLAAAEPAPPATVDDLLRVCRVDEEVDVVILSQQFASLSSADNRRIYIYECDRVRLIAGAATNTGGRDRRSALEFR